MITNVDFAATFLDICGEDASSLPAQQGESFRPLLRGEEVDGWRDSMYYRYWEHDDPEHHAPAHYGVRTATHKFIHYYNDGLGTPGSSDAAPMRPTRCRRVHGSGSGDRRGRRRAPG